MLNLQARLMFHQKGTIGTLWTRKLTLDGFPVDVGYWCDDVGGGRGKEDRDSVGTHSRTDFTNTILGQRE